MPLHKVTCVPRGHALGIVRCYSVNGPGYSTHPVLRRGLTDLSATGR